MERGVLDRGDGVGLAWERVGGRGPTVVFLPGLRSDMGGMKAGAVAGWCAGWGAGCVRFDYSGHGESGGRFRDGTIGQWAGDARRVVEEVAGGEVVLVGSSMGGWIGVLLARAMRRVVGLVGVAAAPDFTERLMWAAMMPAERALLMRAGEIAVPSEYGEDLVITRAMIEDGRRQLVLGGPIGIECPVRLLHGQRDTEVPWELALELAGRVEGADVRVTLVKDGDHRLSRPADLALLRGVLGELLGEGGA